jgi:CheY-like chemotaxis protein
MADPQLLVVEPDPSARGLILSGLRRQGLRAVGASSGYEALGLLDDVTPSLVVSEVALPDLPGTELVRRLRGRRPTAEVPFYFLTGSPEVGVEAARQIGAQDLLRKPAFVSDLATLARLHAGRPAQASLLGGQLEAVGLAHLLRALASGGRSGRVVVLEGEGEVRFHRGRIVEAVFRDRCGESALLRLLTLTRGPFEIAFEGLGGEEPADDWSLNLDVSQLLARGFLHVRRWEQIVASLPPLETAMVVDYGALAECLDEIPDAVNPILRLFDGIRPLESVIDGSSLPDLVALEVVAKLDSLGLLRPAGDAPAPCDTEAPAVAGPPGPSEGDSSPESDSGFETASPDASASPAEVATPAADGMLQSLFAGTKIPEGSAVAALVPQSADWWPDYVKGADPWADILPELPESADPWADHAACDAILESLTAGSVADALVRAQLGQSRAPDMRDLGETPNERLRTRADAPVEGVADASDAAPAEAAPLEEDAGTEASAEATFFDEDAETPGASAEATFFDEDVEMLEASPEAEGAGGAPFPARAFVLGATAALLMGTALLISSATRDGVDATTVASSTPPVPTPAVSAGAAEAGERWAGDDVMVGASLEEPPVAAVTETTPAGTETTPALTETAPAGTETTPAVTETAPTADVSRLLEAGQAAYARGDLAAARQAYARAAETEPESVAAHLGLGLAALDAGRNAEAVAALKRARGLDPQSERAVVLLGTALQLDGDLAGAASAYRRYLEIAPEGHHAEEVRRILAGW